MSTYGINNPGLVDEIAPDPDLLLGLPAGAPKVTRREKIRTVGSNVVGQTASWTKKVGGTVAEVTHDTVDTVAARHDVRKAERSFKKSRIKAAKTSRRIARKFSDSLAEFANEN